MPPIPPNKKRRELDSDYVKGYHLPHITFINEDPDGDASYIFDLIADPLQHIKRVSLEVLEALYPNPFDAPTIKSLKFVLEPFEGVAYACGTSIEKELHISVGYLNDQKNSDRALHEINGVLYHESVHIYQFDGQDEGNSTAPGGFIEGLADYVRYKKGLAPPHWRQRSDPPDEGANWDQGYEHTAYFLMFVEEEMGGDKVPTFALDLNKAMRSTPWSDELVLQTSNGKTIQQLWELYLEFWRGQGKLPCDVDEDGEGEEIDGYHLPYITFINDDPEEDSSYIFSLIEDPLSHMKHVSLEVLKALYPDPSDAPQIKKLKFVVEPLDGVAYTCGSLTHKELHLSVGYLNCQKESDRGRHEIDGVLYHESVHVYQFDGQHDGNSTAPGGFIEGLADYVRYKTGLAPPHWRQRSDPPDKGANWDQGYEHTAFFLMFVDEWIPAFALDLNKALKDKPWSSALVHDITMGPSLEHLWDAYLESFKEKK
jgi:hypothetical protein